MIPELRGQRVLPIRITFAEGLHVGRAAALFAQAELLIDQAQYPRVGAPQLREPLEIRGNPGCLSLVEPATEVGFDKLNQKPKRVDRAERLNALLFGPEAFQIEVDRK